MTKIELSSLRKMLNEKQIPASVWAKNLSDKENGVTKYDNLAKVHFTTVDDNGRERVVHVEPTLAPTDLLDIVSFESLMRSSEFTDVVRKGLIEIIDESEATQLKNVKQPPFKPLPVDEEIDTNKMTSTMIAFNKGKLSEEEVIEIIKTYPRFDREDLVRSTDYIKNEDSVIMQELSKKLSDFSAF